MNQPSRLASRPVFSPAPTSNPRATTVFGPPPLTVRLAPQQATRRIIRRPFATSRRGYDHSWIGLIAFLVLLFAVTSAPLPVG